MNAIRTTTIAVSTLFTMGCAPSSDKVQGSLLATLQTRTQKLEGEVTALRERLLVLEGRGGASPRAVAAKAPGTSSRKAAIREPGPDELPTVRLAPRQGHPPEGRTPRRYAVRPRRMKASRRVVLKLEGTPRYDPVSEPHVSRSSKVLPLGRHYDIREPDGSVARSPGGNASSAHGIYTQALSHYRKERYAIALTHFARLIRDYPKSALIDNALFWQGECYYNMKKYSLALERYRQVIKKFGSENKAPDALFKMAVSYLRLGKKQAGRTMLARVLELYPNSPVAAKASKELERTRD